MLRHPRARELLVWVLATSALFHRVLLEHTVVVGRDALRVSIPLYAHWAERVRALEFPQWFTADAFGQSFIGMTVSAPFHPSHLLALVMPAHWAVTLTVLCCYPLAAAGTAALARRLGADEPGALLAGATYAFCGYLLSMHDALPYLLAAATAPFVLACADDFFEHGGPRRAAIASALWVSCLFAGDAQGFVAVGLGIAVLAAVRKAWRRAGALAAVTALLSAPQSVTALLVAADTPRAQLSLAEMSLWSTHPLRLLELFAGPLFFAQPGTPEGKRLSIEVLGSGLSTLWAASLAVAPVSVVLAALAAWHHRRERNARILVALGLFATWLALGRHLGATQVLSVIPVFKSFRYPEKWMVWPALVLALGAARGLPHVKSPRLFAALGAVAAVVALADLAHTRLAFAVSAGVLAAAALVLRRPAAFVGLAVLAALPAMATLQLADAEALDSARGFAPKVPTGERVHRLMGRLEGAAGEPGRLTTALVDTLDPVARGVEGANDYLPAATRGAVELTESRAWFERRLYQLGSVTWLSVSDPDAAQVAGLEPVARSERWRAGLYRDPAALPPAYFAQVACALHPMLPMLGDARFDRRAQVMLACTRPTPPASGVVRWLRKSPEHRALEVQATGEGALVLTDAYATGWTARVDGAEAVLEPGNVVFQAVRLGPGTHRVELDYRTPGLTAGLLAFALGVLALVLWNLRLTPRALPLRR